MENDIKKTASDIFNELNRYLKLINSKESQKHTNNLFLYDDSSEFDADTADVDYVELYDKKLTLISKDKGVGKNWHGDYFFNSIKLDLLSEDDDILDDSKYTVSQVFQNELEHSPLTPDKTPTQSERITKSDDDMVSNLSSDRVMELEDNSLVCSADANFVNYTYWSVETGENASTTNNPVYFADKNRKVSLLQESEAFVAEGFWGSNNNLFKQTPRHLLLQVTQIANRAFFDPDYRKYLQLNYV